MPTVFLSYSKKDHFFAELADIKLSEAGVNVWRDQGQLRAGADWSQGVEKGISESLAVLVALSANSGDSSYVTFEWAYALGKGKAVIPMKLNECFIHPKLETIQHLDFSVPGALILPKKQASKLQFAFGQLYLARQVATYRLGRVHRAVPPNQNR